MEIKLYIVDDRVDNKSIKSISISISLLWRKCKKKIFWKIKKRFFFVKSCVFEGDKIFVDVEELSMSFWKKNPSFVFHFFVCWELDCHSQWSLNIAKYFYWNELFNQYNHLYSLLINITLLHLVKHSCLHYFFA